MLRRLCGIKNSEYPEYVKRTEVASSRFPKGVNERFTKEHVALKAGNSLSPESPRKVMPYILVSLTNPL